MGSYILRLSVSYDIYDTITIGDMNERNAKKLMEELQDSRVNFVTVDANDHQQLVDLMKSYDIVASAIGPFYKYGPLIAKAAIEAKIPLVDICDDYGPTQEILAMDGATKTAGIPIFMGYGWTPGLTNFLARYGYDKMDKDRPMKMNISWGGGAADSEGLAVVFHVLYAVTRQIPTFLNGKLVDIPAAGGHEHIEFPPPLGIVHVYDCGHPEPVTLPKFLPGVEECTLKGGLTPDWNNNFTGSLKQLHLIQGPKRKRVVGKLVHKFERIFEMGGGINASSARVDILGYRGGKEVHLVYCTPSLPMGELTGYPAAIAAKFYCEGKISGTGVIPAEMVDPLPFFAELKKLGIDMIFDDEGQPKILKKPKAYSPGFLAKYGITGILLLLFGGILGLTGWLIAWIISLI